MFKAHNDTAPVYFPAVTGILLAIVNKSLIETSTFFYCTDCYKHIVCEMQ